jgi:hypothetical protein
MERRESKSRADRREIRSVCMPVPTIVLNNSDKPEHIGLSHSRSAGDLDTTVADVNYEMAGKGEGMTNFSSSVSDDLHDKTQINVNAIGLYCSPRMTRRSAKSPEEPPMKQSGICLDSLNACNLNCLEPGSRVGSTVSLNSEYTARSVGLISNDSNSEYSCHNYPVMDGSLQKHSVLKRFYSTPEKDEDIMNYTSSVRRNSKSLGNMQQEDLENFVSFDFGSDSTADDNFQQNLEPSCDIDESLARRTGYNEDGANSDGQTDRNLVTLVTGSATLRDGRIRKWLTEITEPDENSNS